MGAARRDAARDPGRAGRAARLACSSRIGTSRPWGKAPITSHRRARATSQCSASPNRWSASGCGCSLGRARGGRRAFRGTPITDEAHEAQLHAVQRLTRPRVRRRGRIVADGLALTSAARAPAQTELYARGPHEGTGTSRSAIRISGHRAGEFRRIEPALAQRARACRRGAVDRGFRRLHLRRIHRAQLQTKRATAVDGDAGN